MKNNTIKWSWMGFIFSIYYYAGYGNMKKALCLTLVYYIPVIGWLIAMIYAGAKANEELPIKKIQFNWKNVFFIIVIALVYVLLLTIEVYIEKKF